MRKLVFFILMSSISVATSFSTKIADLDTLGIFVLILLAFLVLNKVILKEKYELNTLSALAIIFGFYLLSISIFMLIEGFLLLLIAPFFILISIILILLSLLGFKKKA